MGDVVYLGVIAAFFSLAALFVKACERIVGPDEAALPRAVSEPEQQAA